MMATLYTILAILAGTVVYLNVSGRTQEDSLFEELVEEGIEQASGIKIDLSPNSDE